MKNKRFTPPFYTSLLLVFFMSVMIGCKKNEEGKTPLLDASKLSAVCKTESPAGSKTTKVSAGGESPYTVSLLAYNRPDDDGNFVWIWSVENPNPGNGENGTVQDLSHWGITLGSCATIGNIVSAASSKNGTDWEAVPAVYKQDKSQDCYSQPVLKFDAGTEGSSKTYYKIVVNKEFEVEKTIALYKSGSKTGCGTFEICGFGKCKDGSGESAPACESRPILASSPYDHNVNSGSKEYYRGSTILGALNVNDVFDYCGSLNIARNATVNSNGLFVMSGSLVVANNLIINSSSKLKIKGALTVLGDLDIKGTIEFEGPGSTIVVIGDVVKSPEAKVIGTYTGTSL